MPLSSHCHIAKTCDTSSVCVTSPTLAIHVCRSPPSSFKARYLMQQTFLSQLLSLRWWQFIHRHRAQNKKQHFDLVTENWSDYSDIKVQKFVLDLNPRHSLVQQHLYLQQRLWGMKHKLGGVTVTNNIRQSQEACHLFQANVKHRAPLFVKTILREIGRFDMNPSHWRIRGRHHDNCTTLNLGGTLI